MNPGGDTWDVVVYQDGVAQELGTIPLESSSAALPTFFDAVFPAVVKRRLAALASSQQLSFFYSNNASPVVTPTFFQAVYPSNVQRSMVAARSARIPSYFGPTSIVAPLPVFFDAVYPSNVERRFVAEASARRESFFWSYNVNPNTVPDFFQAVHPSNVRRRPDASRSAIRPSFFAPVNRPYLPDNDGTIPQIQRQVPMKIRMRSHLRPSFFWPPLLIADTPVTPIGPAGSGTFAMNVEAGARLTMSWLTDVMVAWNGLEQRVALLRWPRLRFDFLTKMTDAQQRSLLSTLAGDSPTAPVFLLGLAYEDLTVVSSVGVAITVNSLARCDWAQPGRRVVVVHPSGSQVDGVIQSASGVSITTTANLSATAVSGARILPVSPVYLEPEQPLQRHRVSATEWQMAATAERPFAVPTMGVGATVTSYDSLPVWDVGVALELAAQPLRSGVDVVDLGGRVARFANFTEANWGRAVRLESSKIAEWQWLKAFLDVVRGRQMPFLLPTGRPDLVPTTDASTGLLTVQGSPTTIDYVVDWFPSLAHRRLRLLKTDGTFAYRIVSGAIDNGNGTQTLTLDSPLVGALSRVEFLETCRLDTDEVAVVFEGPRFAADIPALVVQR